MIFVSQRETMVRDKGAMANHVRYIRKRPNGIYSYERRVPTDVIARQVAFARFGSVRLFRRSLGVRRQAEAMTKGVAVHEWFETQLRAVNSAGHSSARALDAATRPLTPEILKKLSENARVSTVKPWAKQAVLAELGGECAEELERMIHERELDAEEYSAVLFKRALGDVRMPKFDEMAAAIISSERLFAPVGSDAYALVRRTIREGVIAGEREVDAIISGNQSVIPPSQPGRKATSLRLSEAVDRYVGRVRSQRTIGEAKSAFASFREVIGDLPLDEITKDDFMRFCEAEGSRVVGGKTPDSIQRPMSAATLKKKVTLLRSAIQQAISTGQHDGVNPAAGIDVSQFTKPVPKDRMPDKRPFTIHELNLLLQHPWFVGCKDPHHDYTQGEYRLNDSRFWVPIVGLYTGCRASELGGLKLSEVRHDHQHPHIVIQDNEYRPTKGSYRRSVPILDALLKLGFGAFVESVAARNSDRLFSDWEPPKASLRRNSTAWANGKLIRAFNRTVIPQRLGSLLPDGVRQEVTFHSFRGAFKTMLLSTEPAIQMNYIHEVVGHSKSALDKRYVGEIPIDQTYPRMRHCDYQGLVLPTPP